MVPPRLLPLLLAFVQAVCAEITYVPGGYIVTIAPSPPPPPLSDVKPNWTALYFFLGVLGMYLLVMGLVLWKGRAKPISAGEGMPLNDKPSDSEAPVTEKGPATRPEGRARSWMELRQSGYEPPSLESIDKEIKKGFVRKIYSILGTQLLVTVAVCVIMIYSSFYKGDPYYPTSFGYYYIRQQWITFLVLILMLVVLCGLFSMKNIYPINYGLLSLFTVALSFTLGR